MSAEDDKMEHLKKKWGVVQNEDSRSYILTDEENPLVIAEGVMLPGDYVSEKTFKYICELHNERLRLSVPK